MQWNELKTHLRHISSKDLLRVQKAFELGKQVHGDQKRKSGEPYFMHPIAVTHILANMGADADALIAALLHDTVEDTDLTLKEIDKEFNGDVASLIDGVTKLEPEDVAEEPTLDDQIETLRKMFTLIEEDARVIVIKLVDRLHNMQTIEHLKPEKQKALAQETLDVYVKIADRISMQEMRDELEGLCLSVLETETYVSLLEIREKNEQAANKAIDQMMQTLKAEEGLDEEFSMHYEKKPWRKLRMQMNTSKAATGVADVICAVVCDSVPDIYVVLGALHQHWARETLSFQDFINTPMINGYRGLHTTIIMESGIRVRCKIRTTEMEEYARDGIATVCFDNERRGLMEYLLPWTQRISRLSKDTERDSDAFWESLQSDILGESIVIHGPDDTRIMLPTGSTALDGAFYFLKTKALKLKNIAVDGIDVPFYTPLTHGASIDFSTGRNKTVQRSWLDWVNTGTAVAHIRSSLSQESKAVRREVGKDLLQKLFTQHKKGYIEEFDEQALKKATAQLGYNSLETTYEAIADGHIDPEDIYEKLFRRNDKKDVSALEKVPCTISFTLNFDDIDSISNVLKVYKKFNINLRKVRFRPFSFIKGRVRVNHVMTPKQEAEMMKDLKSAGAQDVESRRTGSLRRFWFGVAFLLTIWGFDPAIAYRIIHEFSISPVDLTLLRFWALAGISGVLVLWKTLQNDIPQTRLPLRSKSLWASVLLMISVSLFGYTALQTTQPIFYTIPMTAAGVLLTTIVNREFKKIIIATWLLLGAGVAIGIAYTPSWNLTGVVATLLTVLSFSLFSVVSERYKRAELIGARSAQYFFLLSVLSAILTLPLLSISTITSLPREAVIQIILFSFFFAGVPYYMYYYLLSYKQIDMVLRYSYIIIGTTMLGQILFSPSAPPITKPTIISGLVVAIGAMLPVIQRRLHRQKTIA